jgi:diadenosine tetraphosphate (Ap4A) HIT family hydrolase
MQKFSGLWAGELVELQQIAQEYEAILEQLGWKPDHMNYAMLGNDFREHTGHGHMHIIPRYKEPREFVKVTFVDDQWGKNYAPETPFELHKEVLMSIVAVLQDELERKTA